MKQIKGLLEEIRGSTKHNTFKTYTDKRKLVIMTKRPIPSYTRTEEQDQQRTLFSDAVTAWNDLSEEEKQEYAELARPYALTGYQYFIKQYLLAPAPPGIWYKVTIDNTESLTNLVDYQIRIEILNDAQFFTDAENKREAIRVYDSDKTTPLSYWIEEWDTTNHNARIWVKVPSIPAGGITYLYISIDPSRTEDASSGEETFLFFDDFITNTPANYTLRTDSKNDVHFAENVLSDVPAIIEYRFKISKWDADSPWGTHQGVGFADSVSVAPNNWRTANTGADSDYADNSHLGMMAYNRKDASSNIVRSGITDVPFSLNTYYIHEIEISYTETKMHLHTDDRATEIYSLSNSNNIPTATLPHLMLYQYHGDEIGSTYAFEWDGTTHLRWYGKRNGYTEQEKYIDWIFLRKYASTKPSISYQKET